MKDINRKTIVVTCDTHYLTLLAALLKSIEVNSLPSDQFDVFVIESDIRKKNKEKLINSLDKNRLTVYWLNMKEVIPKGMELPLDKSTYPLNIYSRIFAPHIIPDHVEKLLYLDVDMIALENISELFKIELGDSPLAAVMDPRIITFDNTWGGITNYRELGIAGNTKYFNTGLLLINTKVWKHKQITMQIMQCLNDNIKYLNYPDQYGLNVVLANKWIEINPSWNHFALFDSGKPSIVHFVERKPIFKSYSNVPKFQELFFEYLSLTQWKGYKRVGEISRYSHKIHNIFDKLRLSVLRKAANG